MKKLLLLFVGLLCFVGCSDDVEVVEYNSFEVEISAKTSNLDYIKQRIGMEHPQTRAGEMVSIEPYVYEGDTVMYIVNYEDGWELYSNDTSVPMVIAKAEQGNYVCDSLPLTMSKYLEDIAHNLYTRRMAGLVNSDVLGDWQLYSSGISPFPIKDSILALEINGEGLPPSFVVNYEDNVGQGIWQLIRTVSEEVDTIGYRNHLILTKWGIATPWNRYAPFVYGVHGFNSTASVALGQLFTYLYKKFRAPFQVPMSLIYNEIKNRYYPTSYGPDILDHVAINIYDSAERIDSTAILIGGIGDYLWSSYDSEGYPNVFYTRVHNYLRYLGINESTVPMSFEYLTNSIDNSKPVLARMTGAVGNEPTWGCYAIIDAYRHLYTHKRLKYGWVGYDNDGNLAMTFDENGHINYYKYVCYRDVEFETKNVQMNWCQDGSYDNTWFADGETFSIGSTNYQPAEYYNLSFSPYF